MENLHDLICTIAKRPEIYLGRPLVQRLYAFIGGYLWGNPAADDHCLDGFNEFVAQRFGICSDHNWADIIEFISAGEADEFRLFMKLFEEYTSHRRK